MPIRKSIETRPKQLISASTDGIIQHLERFSKKRPMMVSQALYDQLSKRKGVEHLMDRVKVQTPRAN